MELNMYNFATSNLVEKPKEDKEINLFESMTKKFKPDKSRLQEFNLFGEYKEKLKAHPPKQPEYVDLNYADDISVSVEALRQVLANIDNMPEQEIYNLIVGNYKFILKEIFSGNNHGFIGIWTNTKTLTIVNQAFYNINLTYEERIYCNKIVYDYITMSASNTDDYVKHLLLLFSKIVNRDIIPRLNALGIDEELCVRMAMARFSSMKEIINTRRLNLEIINQPSELMTEQMIVNIYCVLYNKLLPLFEGIIFDVWNVSDLNGNEDMLEIYATINLALLDIINELESNKIRLLLESYLDEKRLIYPDSQVRFNIRSFSPTDYPRLYDIISKIDMERGTVVSYQ